VDLPFTDVAKRRLGAKLTSADQGWHLRVRNRRGICVMTRSGTYLDTLVPR